MIDDNITVENAKIGFRNFGGAAGKYNPEGSRNFCVFFDHQVGEALQAAGWNIKWAQPRDEGDYEVPYLQVAVAFNSYPPKIVLVTTGGKQVLDDTTISQLDFADIEHVDLTIRPYNWDVNGKTGVKAYVKTMYVTLAEDEFENKYLDVPDSAVSCIGANCGTKDQSY